MPWSLPASVGGGTRTGGAAATLSKSRRGGTLRLAFRTVPPAGRPACGGRLQGQISCPARLCPRAGSVATSARGGGGEGADERKGEWRKNAFVQEVPLSSVSWIPPKRGAKFRDETAGMARQLKGSGQLEAIDVWEVEGHFYLTSGRSLRMQALWQFSHITKVRCRIKGPPPEGFPRERYEPFPTTCKRWRSEDEQKKKLQKLRKKREAGRTQKDAKRVFAGAGGGLESQLQALARNSGNLKKRGDGGG